MRLALRVAEELHPELGRVLLCVDEVALYLTGNPDRVREGQGLAEMVRSKGKGKVFLWVTAQQWVDTIDQHFAALDRRVGFLRDRFPARFPLEERDIDTVVRERWLKKDAGNTHLASLQRLVKDQGGLLARAAKLHDESLAVRALEEALAPSPPPKAKSAQTITMDLRSAEDLPRLYERIIEVPKEALAQPRRVCVTFENPDEAT